MTLQAAPPRRASADRIATFVAMGDSFTAGTGALPGEAWPERLAAGLGPRVQLHNLAVHGATSAEVLEQLPEALDLEPELVTVVCGANDVLTRPRPDVDAYGARLGTILGRLRRELPGAVAITATAPDRWDFLGLGPRTSQRVTRSIAELNAATRAVAAEHGVACLDVAGHPGLSEAENFCADGLHPSALGHRHAAVAFAALAGERLGIEIELEGASDDR